jgi:hypothetical protein
MDRHSGSRPAFNALPAGHLQDIWSRHGLDRTARGSDSQKPRVNGVQQTIPPSRGIVGKAVHPAVTVLVVIRMTVAPGPISALVVAVPPLKFTMFPMLFRFPTPVRTGFTFIPLMVIMVLAIVISMDFMVFVIVVAVSGVAGISPKSRWRNHGCYQNERT